MSVCVCLSVSLSVWWSHGWALHKRIKMPFRGKWICVGARNHMLDGGTYGHDRAITVEWLVLSGESPLVMQTLTAVAVATCCCYRCWGYIFTFQFVCCLSSDVQCNSLLLIVLPSTADDGFSAPVICWQSWNRWRSGRDRPAGIGEVSVGEWYQGLSWRVWQITPRQYSARWWARLKQSWMYCGHKQAGCMYHFWQFASLSFWLASTVCSHACQYSAAWLLLMETITLSFIADFSWSPYCRIELDL